MDKKILSLTLLIIFLAVFPLVNALDVECARDSDCENGEVCQKIGNPDDWYCTQGQGDPSFQDVQRIEQYSNNDNSSMLIGFGIIGACILVGFIILAIILSRKKK